MSTQQLVYKALRLALCSVLVGQRYSVLAYVMAAVLDRQSFYSKMSYPDDDDWVCTRVCGGGGECILHVCGGGRVYYMCVWGGVYITCVWGGEGVLYVCGGRVYYMCVGGYVCVYLCGCVVLSFTGLTLWLHAGVVGMDWSPCLFHCCIVQTNAVDLVMGWGRGVK